MAFVNDLKQRIKSLNYARNMVTLINAFLKYVSPSNKDNSIIIKLLILYFLQIILPPVKTLTSRKCLMYVSHF